MAMIAGVFKDEEAVQQALQELLEHHYDPSQVSIMVSDHHHREAVAVEHVDGIAPGSRIGAVVGAVLGATLVATGVLAGPGGLLAAGPVLQALGGAAAGAASGTAYGAFLGMDFWDEVADLHATEVGDGAVWIAVHAEGREGDAEAALRQHGALHVVQVKG
jgi:hypothetical protein